MILAFDYVYRNWPQPKSTRYKRTLTVKAKEVDIVSKKVIHADFQIHIPIYNADRNICAYA